MLSSLLQRALFGACHLCQAESFDRLEILIFERIVVIIVCDTYNFGHF